MTFVIDGVREEQILPYGTMPTHPTTPHRAPTESTYFVFSGWDVEPAPVSGDAEYIALFEEKFYLPFPEGGGAELCAEGGALVADCVGTASQTLSLEKLVTYAHDLGMSVVLNTRFSRITLSYSVLNSMITNGDTTISLSVVQNGVHGYSYQISLTGESGVAGGSYRLSVSTPSRLRDADRARLFYLDGEERVYCAFTYSDGAVSYYHTTGKTYTVLYEYSVNLLPTSKVELSASHSLAKPGEWVYLTVEPPLGVEVKRVYLTLDDGTELDVKDGKFRMPSSDVSVGVVYSTLKYRVTFMNKDKVIISTLYEYGDTVVPPKPPERMNSELYSFTFVGWSMQIVPVTADAVYYAEYELHLLPLPESGDRIYISEGIMRLIVLLSVGVGALLFVLIPASVVAVIKVKKYRRWRRGTSEKKR